MIKANVGKWQTCPMEIMKQAQNDKFIRGNYEAKTSFETTLEAIKNIDSKTYEEYKSFIENSSPFQQ